MNENARLWCDVLESGEYEQGHNILCKDGKFCCLGVACDIYQKVVGDLVVSVGAFGHKVYDDYDKILPDKVKNWLGLTSRAGTFETGQGPYNHLTMMNDTGKEFQGDCGGYT